MQKIPTPFKEDKKRTKKINPEVEMLEINPQNEQQVFG